jgi:hypothetical protein
LPDRHLGRGRKAKRFQFLRIYFDVFVSGILKAFDNVSLFDLTCVIDILVMHPLVRLSIDLVELNLLARISSREHLDSD